MYTPNFHDFRREKIGKSDDHRRAKTPNGVLAPAIIKKFFEQIFFYKKKYFKKKIFFIKKKNFISKK
jgi:hypothetical protein